VYWPDLSGVNRNDGSASEYGSDSVYGLRIEKRFLLFERWRCSDVLHLSQMLDRVEPKSSRSETLRLTLTQFAVEQFVLFFK
jgi:hypothetical protein